MLAMARCWRDEGIRTLFLLVRFLAAFLVHHQVACALLNESAVVLALHLDGRFLEIAREKTGCRLFPRQGY